RGGAGGGGAAPGGDGVPTGPVSAAKLDPSRFSRADCARLAPLGAKYQQGSAEMLLDHVTRRYAMLLLGGAATAWPVRARAQRPAVPVVGYLRVTQNLDGLAAFRRGLSEHGYVEGRDVAIEIRETQQYDRLPALVAELVRRPAAVIFAAASVVAVQAAMAATATIPIVFTTGADPVREGLVARLNRPGGNVKGVTFFAAELGPK